MIEVPNSDTYVVGQFLVLFGAAVSFVFGVLYLLNVGVGVTFLPSINLLYILGTLHNFLVGVLLIILSLTTAATFRHIKRQNILTVIFFLGIATFLIGGTLGGVLVLIGSILMHF